MNSDFNWTYFAAILRWIAANSSWENASLNILR